MSHPIWVRGLKPEVESYLNSPNGVAPHMGAWIETTTRYNFETLSASRTPYGCVD